MKIKPIVEGHGDVIAVPELLRRLQSEYGIGAHEVQIARPIRWDRSRFNSEFEVKRVVRLAATETECVGILIVIDSDDDCPKVYAEQVATWGRQVAGGIPCEVVLAHREYEGWFLSTIESLRGCCGILPDAGSEANPEAIRGAKERLETKMNANRSYAETTDQVTLTCRADFGVAYANCRSFRRLVSAFRSLLNACGADAHDFALSV